jgi:hypothetical protein
MFNTFILLQSKNKKIFNSNINKANFSGVRREFQAPYKSDESSSSSSSSSPPSGQNIFRLVVYVHVLFQELYDLRTGYHFLSDVPLSFTSYNNCKFGTIFPYNILLQKVLDI